jgi:hypothetical protein
MYCTCGSTAERAREMRTGGLYMGRSARSTPADREWLAASTGDDLPRQVVPTVRANLEWLSALSRDDSGRWVVLQFPRDVGGDAVGVTSVVPVVTSGRDVGAWRQWRRPSWRRRGCRPGHYIIVSFSGDSRSRHLIQYTARNTKIMLGRETSKIRDGAREKKLRNWFQKWGKTKKTMAVGRKLGRKAETKINK